MHRGENSDPIPIDLVDEILSRSSAKSIARFRLASKLCTSIVSRPDFTELFMKRSSARPRLLFALEQNREWRFYSSPQIQPENPDENSSLVVADSHMESPGEMCSEICGPVSGLIYFPNMRISKRDTITAPVIYNPSTGQYTSLPKPVTKKKGLEKSFLGYDPIDKQFKVLFSCEGEDHQILTLGTGEVSWRMIEIPLTHYPLGEGICINGVLYYLAPEPGSLGGPPRGSIVCLDVRSENVWFLKGKSINEFLKFDVSKLKLSKDFGYNYGTEPTKLINYNGKLGGISSIWLGQFEGMRRIGLSLWVLEDAKKQEWSRRDFLVKPVIECEASVPLVVIGITATGEIILSMNSTSKPFYVLYFNPEKNTIARVEIQGFETFETRFKVYTFVDQVEDFKFIDSS